MIVKLNWIDNPIYVQNSSVAEASESLCMWEKIKSEINSTHHPPQIKSEHRKRGYIHQLPLTIISIVINLDLHLLLYQFKSILFTLLLHFLNPFPHTPKYGFELILSTYFLKKIENLNN